MMKEDAGFLYKLSRPIVNGNSIWTGKKFRIVLPYGFLVSISFLLALSVLINIYLHIDDISWFKSMIDLSFVSGVFVISVELMHNSNSISELCEDLDRWWWYMNFQEETIEIKMEIEKKLIFITEYGFYCEYCINLFILYDQFILWYDANPLLFLNSEASRLQFIGSFQIYGETLKDLT